MCLVWKNLKILFPLETCERCTFFSKKFAVRLYPVSVVARAFQYIVATIFVVSIACGSESHCVT